MLRSRVLTILTALVVATVVSQSAPAFWIAGLKSDDGFHQRISRRAINDVSAEINGKRFEFKKDPATDAIVRATTYPDVGKYNDFEHFDNEAFKEGEDSIINRRQLLKDALLAGQSTKAWDALGTILHSIQDFYAHSSWIHDGAHPGLAPFYEVQLPDDPSRSAAFLNAMLPSASSIAGCDGEYGETLRGSPNVTTAYYKKNKKFSKSEQPFIPANAQGMPKCVHLGITVKCDHDNDGDFSRSDCWPGFEKDHPDGPLHMVARNRAREASAKFVQDLVDELLGMQTPQARRAICTLMGYHPDLCAGEVVEVWVLNRICVNSVAGFSFSKETSTTNTTPRETRSTLPHALCHEMPEFPEVRFCRSGTYWIPKVFTSPASDSSSGKTSVDSAGTFEGSFKRNRRTDTTTADGSFINEENLSQTVRVNHQTGDHYAVDDANTFYSAQRGPGSESETRTMRRHYEGTSTVAAGNSAPRAYINMFRQGSPIPINAPIPDYCYGDKP